MRLVNFNTKEEIDMSVYGYARVSTKHQKLERQIDNIKAINEEAVIITEKYSGTTQERPAWMKLKKTVKKGDTIIFDEVFRMSRTTEEGFEEYKELYDKGINLVFNKQRHLDTDTFKEASNRKVPMTDTDVDIILRAVNEYLMILAEKQIKIAFDSAESEVDLLHKRISEGLARAKVEGQQIGQVKGTTWETKKSKQSKESILKYCKEFNGSLNDEECVKLIGISRNSYYKYKREIKAGL